MILNPKQLQTPGLDARSREILEKTVAFFEAKGKRRLRQDDLDRVWYADFLDFLKRERVFADLLTPPEHGEPPHARWDTYRNCFFNEVLGFYGLCYWYTWQVSILGLGPVWMSANQALRQRAARALAEGGIFAFGLSEKQHGADIYSTETALRPAPGGGWLARGGKYYIGNGNEAALVSVFGRLGPDEYVFFAADPRRPGYQLVQNVVASQSYVAEFNLDDYAVGADEILSRGPAAWDAALNTVNVGKYNLGWASIGICTHAFHEALNHAAGRRLYGMAVTDFQHVARMFTDAWARLLAMKLFALRACDYQRSASLEDRRYLLYNPVVKMKVTTEGEKVVDLLWDVIAAKGFEKDTYFEMAARDIRALPKLEGTVHVNIALIVKFMANYLFRPAALPEVPRRDDPAHDAFLFGQGPAHGLGKIRFHDPDPVFARHAGVPNVALFREQIAAFRQLLAAAAPSEEQRKDVGLLLALGEIFTLIVYGQLVLEEAPFHAIPPEVLDQVFDVFVRDLSRYALDLHAQPSASPAQAELCLRMVRRPAHDAGRWAAVWQGQVLALRDAYRMSD